MDQDRHCGAVEMGNTAITIKDAEQMVEDPVKFSTAQFIKQRKKVLRIIFDTQKGSIPFALVIQFCIFLYLYHH